MDSIVTVGYIQSLQSEVSNTITASVPAQPITERCAAVCATELFPFAIITQSCRRGQLWTNLYANCFSSVHPLTPKSPNECR